VSLILRRLRIQLFGGIIRIELKALAFVTANQFTDMPRLEAFICQIYVLMNFRECWMAFTIAEFASLYAHAAILT